MERRIMHLQVVSFQAAVARVRDPSLRDRPLVLARGRSARAVITEVSHEACPEGVRRGMLLGRARTLCRRLVAVPPDPDLAARAMAAMTEMIRRTSPLVEPARNGQVFADLTGTGRLLGSARDTAWRLHGEMARRLDLPCRIGLAANKLVSRMASRVGPQDALADIHPGREASFLSPLPALLLPAIRSVKERSLLADLRLHKVRDLTALPFSRLLLAFQERGPLLYRQARGRDDSPVRPPTLQPELHVEETLSRDTNDDAILEAVMFLLVQRACRRLRAAGLQPGRALVSIQYADHQGARRSLKLRPQDSGEQSLALRLQPLLAAFCSRRTRLRWMGLTLSDLQPEARQLPLFPGVHGEPEDRHLASALDRIRGRYGERAIRRLSPGLERAADSFERSRPGRRISARITPAMIRTAPATS
ncbi:MAG: DNA polymerase IV [Acidobacteriota bacterium]